ncbi:hypothetical protein N9L68_06140 [bacterium]|nr:hypothetical protein [bacterium]
MQRHPALAEWDWAGGSDPLGGRRRITALPTTRRPCTGEATSASSGSGGRTWHRRTSRDLAVRRGRGG